MAAVRPPRLIDQRELAVLTAALQTAGTGLFDWSGKDLGNLRIISQCDCGCASVDFASSKSKAPREMLADGIAITANNKYVGVIVWGDRSEVTGLEIYPMGGDDLSLPSPLSIMSWETFGKRKLK
ncbi:MAG TPA: hypothetical protein VJ727_03280 [Rhodanobacteraceae bacterium]|nr:hypothetical protein [Rhodanobacteraceae bacterium]